MAIPEGLTSATFLYYMERTTMAHEFMRQQQYHLVISTLSEIPSKYISINGGHFAMMMAYFYVGAFQKAYDMANIVLSTADNKLAENVKYESYSMIGGETYTDKKEKDKNKDLFIGATIVSGNKDLLEELLNEDYEPTYTFNNPVFGPGNPGLLHLAIANGQQDIIQYLITRGVDVNQLNHGWSPLHLAVLFNEPQIVAILLDNKAEVDSKPTNVTPVQLASLTNNYNLVKILIAYGANITDDLYPLSNLGVSEDVVLIKDSHTMKIDKLKAPLHFYAAATGKLKLLQVLYETGKIDLNTPSPTNKNATLLHMACGRGASGDRSFSDIVSFLIDNGAQVNVLTDKKYSPLHFACRVGDEDSKAIVQMLIDAGADMYAVSDLAEETPLLCALLSANTFATEVLIVNGVEYESAEQKLRHNIVTWSVVSGLPQILVSVLTGFRERYAIQGDDPASVNQKLETLVNARLGDNFTALHWACIKGDMLSTQLLLTNGADPTATGVMTRKKFTPLQCARHYKVGSAITGTNNEAAMAACERLLVSHLDNLIKEKAIEQLES